MKLRFTLVIEQEIKSDKELVEYYEAQTVQEAAKNQQVWCDDGTCDLSELVCNAEEVTVVVEGIE